MLFIRAFIFILISSFNFNVFAGSSCSATNDNNDARCSISCSNGETAICEDGSGSSTPTCECRNNNLSVLESKETVSNKLLTNKFLSNIPNVGALSKISAAGSDSAPLTSQIKTTNIVEAINNKLYQQKDYKLFRRCYDVFVRLHCVAGDCMPIMRERCDEYIGKLTTTGKLYLESEPIVKIKGPNWQEIPQNILGFRETYTNCTTLNQQITFNHSESVKVGTRVTHTKAIATNQSLSIKTEFTFADVGANFSRTVTITDQNEQTQEDTKNLSFSLPVTIPASSRVQIDHQYIKRVIPVKFDGSVTLDADLVPNLERVSKVSHVLTNIEDRKFDFSGYVHNSVLAEGKTKVLQTPLTSENCNATDGFTTFPEFYKTE